MVVPPADARQFFSWPGRIIGALAGLLGGFMVVLIPSDIFGWNFDSVGWIGVALGLVLAWRCLRVQLTISDQEVLVRNLFHTAAFPLHEVAGFRRGPGYHIPFTGDMAWIDLKSAKGMRVNALEFGLVPPVERARERLLADVNAELSRRQAAAPR